MALPTLAAALVAWDSEARFLDGWFLYGFIVPLVPAGALCWLAAGVRLAVTRRRDSDGR